MTRGWSAEAGEGLAVYADGQGGDAIGPMDQLEFARGEGVEETLLLHQDDLAAQEAVRLGVAAVVVEQQEHIDPTVVVAVQGLVDRVKYGSGDGRINEKRTHGNDGHDSPDFRDKPSPPPRKMSRPSISHCVCPLSRHNTTPVYQAGGSGAGHSGHIVSGLTPRDARRVEAAGQGAGGKFSTQSSTRSRRSAARRTAEMALSVTRYFVDAESGDPPSRPLIGSMRTT